MDLINRWQYENCSIRFDFISVDHAVEITCPAFLRVSATIPVPGGADFYLADNTERRWINVKLPNDDSCDIVDIQRDGHPTFKVKVDYILSLRIPFGNLGDLYIYELETAGSKKVM
jgi:hypothetical protein